MRGRACLSVALGAVLAISGCGYTTKTLLPENIRTVHVAPVKNTIDLSAEVSDTTPFRVYRPGIEVELTNALINRFIFDGTLKVVLPERADAVVEVSLVDYRRDPLRYSDGDDVQEYRLSIVMDARMIQKSDGVALWSKRITGDTTFFIVGSRAITEDQAAQRVVEDAARRVIEATIEYW